MYKREALVTNNKHGRYIMSQQHPDYFNGRRVRSWCTIEKTEHHSNGETHVEVFWRDNRGDRVGFEAVPLEWLVPLGDEWLTNQGKEEKEPPQLEKCISLW